MPTPDTLETSRAPTGTASRPKSSGNPFRDDEAYPWHHFVARHGAEGRTWTGRYLEPDCVDLRDGIQEGLDALRAGDEPRGARVFAAVREGIDALEPSTPGLRPVMLRWFWTAHAYLSYVRGRFDEAIRELDRAQEEVAAAVGAAPWLVPVTMRCPEIAFQQARTAARQRHWSAMAAYLGRVRATLEDRAPLVVLADGHVIDFPVLQAFFVALDDLDAEERRYLRSVFDPATRQRRFRAFAQQLYAAPGWVISYP